MWSKFFFIDFRPSKGSFGVIESVESVSVLVAETSSEKLIYEIIKNGLMLLMWLIRPIL